MRFLILLATIYSCQAQAQKPPESDQAAYIEEFESYQFQIAYKVGNLSAEIAGDRALEETPQAAVYEDNQPVTGTFSGGSVSQIRSSLSSISSTLEKARQFWGLGVDNLTAGTTSNPMEKSGGSTATLQITSLYLHYGILKDINKYSQVSAQVAYDHMMFGKFRSRYLINSGGGTQNYGVIEDYLTSGYKLSISGNYLLNINSGLGFGMVAGIQIGKYKLESRSEDSAISGFNFGLTTVLRL